MIYLELVLMYIEQIEHKINYTGQINILCQLKQEAQLSQCDVLAGRRQYNIMLHYVCFRRSVHNGETAASHA